MVHLTFHVSLSSTVIVTIILVLLIQRNWRSSTLSERSQVCVSLCVFLPFVFHCTPSNSFFCPLDRHSEYSVLARRVGRSFCLLKSCNNTRTNTVQVSIQPVLCLLKVVIYLSPYFLTLKCISVNIVLILILVVCVLFVLWTRMKLFNLLWRGVLSLFKEIGFS